ncbi:MAG: chloride channel protein [Flavobacteriia bacterium]|nr:chloride channel protein [Flavobacteriia bacterium]
MTQRPNTLLGRFLHWRIRHIPQRQFILILSVLVGLVSGTVSVLLKFSVRSIQDLLRGDMLSGIHELFQFAFPLLGILITVLIARWIIREPIGDGIPSTLYAISKKNGIIRSFRMYASVITSSITVGFGGSVGLEGPTVSTGSAIGSNLARLMHLNYPSRILLISCATTGALSSILHTPIAAVVFAIEVFSLDLTLTSLVPLLLSSVSGAVMSHLFGGSDYLFPYIIAEAFEIRDLPYFIALGTLAAFFSIYFNRVYFGVEKLMKRIGNPYLKLFLGGLALGGLIYLIPPLYGEGYSTINHLLNSEVEAVLQGNIFVDHLDSELLIILLLMGLVLFKGVATSLTLHAGGVGGIFAPTLFMGSALGYVFARVVNYLGISDLSESNFSLVGMAALLSGVIHAPLTAIFLIAEVSGGYELFLPLMIVSSISYAVVKAFVPHSIYAISLAKRGELITHDKDRAVLTLMKLDSVVEKDFRAVRPEWDLGELVQTVAQSKRNLFPVLDEEGRLLGVLTLDDIRPIMFQQDLYARTFVRDLMHAPPDIIDSEEHMEKVIRKFQDSGAWNLPVTQGGMYKGFVSKSKLFGVYRRKLIEFSGEQ